MFCSFGVLEQKYQTISGEYLAKYKCLLHTAISSCIPNMRSADSFLKSHQIWQSMTLFTGNKRFVLLPTFWTLNIEIPRQFPISKKLQNKTRKKDKQTVGQRENYRKVGSSGEIVLLLTLGYRKKKSLNEGAFLLFL